MRKGAGAVEAWAQAEAGPERRGWRVRKGAGALEGWAQAEAGPEHEKNEGGVCECAG